MYVYVFNNYSIIIKKISIIYLNEWYTFDMNVY